MNKLKGIFNKPTTKIITIILNLWFLLIIITHMVVKDRILGFSLVLYATPLPLVIIFSAVLGTIWFVYKHFRLFIVYLSITFIILLSWYNTSYKTNLNAVKKEKVRVLFWNIYKGKAGAKALSSHINQQGADVIGLVEADISDKESESIWKNTFTDYVVETFPGKMMIISKGNILHKQNGSLNGKGDYSLLEIELNNKKLNVIVVHLRNDPIKSRELAFGKLVEIIQTYRGTNLVVMGDFNTPKNSIFFEPFYKGLNNAFEMAGKGFSETWPATIPILTIDHIWVSNRIKLYQCFNNSVSLSDHKYLVTDIGFN